MDNKWLIDCDWLAACMGPGNERVHVLDASWYLPQELRDPLVEFQLKRIPGAKFFDWEEIRPESPPNVLLLPSAEQFAEYVGTLGIGNEDTVVVYDAEGIHSCAARCWWMFRAFGHERVLALNGGLKQWINEGRELADRITQIAPVLRKTGIFQTGMVRHFEQITDNLIGQDEQVVDVRSPERYYSVALRAKPGERHGHIPGSVNLPFTAFLDPKSHKLLSLSQLEKFTLNAGVNINQPVIVYCGGGGSSPVVALGLTLIGCKQVAVYDGAWTDWSSRPDAPIEVL